MPDVTISPAADGCPAPVPSPTAYPVPSSDRGAALFLWGTWAVMLVTALLFVRAYGSAVPYMDEWDMVPYLTGNEPITLKYLWAQHNEHRIPLPKALLFLLARLTGGDSRGGMYLQVGLLAVLAFALIRGSQGLRGRLSYADAFFPVALLHLGHCENLLWNFQVAFVLPTALAGILLLQIAQSDRGLTWSAAVVSGVCLIGLSLCGAHGLVFVPLLALWLFWRGLRHWTISSGPGSLSSLVLWLSSLTALTLMALNFVGYQKPPQHPPPPDLVAALKVGLQTLAVSYGPGAKILWPYGALLVAGLAALSGLILILAWWRKPEERLRAAGLLFYLASLGLLVLAIGWGRAGLDPRIGFSLRYSTLTVLALCCVYLVWTIGYLPAFRSLVPQFLYAVGCGLLLSNLQIGWEAGRAKHKWFQGTVRDLRAGLPSELVAQRSPFLHPNRDYLTQCIDMLRRAEMGKFKPGDRPRGTSNSP